ncbi:glycosyl transferase group 1 (plasmid) [Haloarcula marismortui ATCC 43049]|jgi:glycosyltransferase involved in cell wall biosynthesis|uniref:Glycosyl transferase group 1 n=1 Tax=Haloarcula marismortui (strain ATCC 43049 / DSM 3752 / JCM 8966 / VKM B-1809) TaxID=272569 RepID=Q5V6W9_HALMA|nr:glycosyltransferase [Haloarcula marismortui]AAV44733.1 glycosyl transferase group 1 [Haloarcula marismortui ATCC 43049]QCP90052.1 glycosyltransferase [Haloarcula marismortui ATCC 43049]
MDESTLSDGTGSAVSTVPEQDTSTATDGDRPLLAFFIPDLSVGGAEQVAITIANGLATRGYDIDLLLSRASGELRSELSEQVSIVELPPSTTPVVGVAAHLPFLATYLNKRKPAALFPHLEHPSIVSLAINRFLNTDTAVIPTQHSAFGHEVEATPKDQIVRRIVPRLYPASDQIVSVSEGVADSLTDRTPVERSDISVLYNPVDVEQIRERASQPVEHEWVEGNDRDVVLFVGRHARQKNLDGWVRAFEKIVNKNPDARAIIAGKGPCREQVQATVERLGLSDTVSLPGFVDNPYRYMRKSDVFLLSSRYEGLPTVLIECLAVGCPVVSTDCPSGPREILSDGEHGTLVPMDDIDGLANAVCDTLADPPDSDRLRSRADDFSPKPVFDAYEQFLEEHVFTS